MKPKLFLIDGFALIYRAYFAFGTRPLITDEGFNVSAIYGFFNTLFKLIDKEQPEYIAMVLDPSGKTFRNDIYEEYKATRQKMPEDLRNSLPILFDMVEAFNLYTITMDNYEADDVIGSIAKQGEIEGFDTYMFSSDKDLCQLVSENVFLYDPKGDQIVDKEGVFEKFGVRPDQIIDYLALMGDSSDNVPGVPKVGKKTAVDLLNQFDSMEKLYTNVELLTKKAVKNSLKENRELAELSKILVTIKTDLPTGFKLENSKFKNPNITLLSEKFIKFKMKSLVKQMEKFGSGEILSTERSYDESKKSYHLIEEEEKLKLFIKDELKPLKNSSEISIFIFGEGFKVYGLSIGVSEGKAYYIDLVERKDSKNLFDYSEKIQKFINLLKPELERFNIIGSDLKTTMRSLHPLGIKLNPSFDSLLAHYSLYSHESNHSIERIADKLLNYRTIDITDIAGKSRKKIPYENITPEEIYIYSNERADILFEIKRKLTQLLNRNNLTEIYNMEFSLMPILLEMELKGITLDKPYMNTLKQEFGLMIEERKNKIIDLAGEDFNPDSPKQLGTILFEKLELPHGKKGKSKNYSTDVKVLEKLRNDGFKIADEVLAYRELTKLNSTYINGLIKLVDDNNRIHTNYNQTITATGRLSSTEPNLQNIPIKTPKGELIRKAFIPKKGYSILAADYSQIELRVLAHYCKDEALIEAFRNNEDIHQKTASILFDLNINNVSREMRSKAKVANFSIIYGKSKFGLSEDLGISFKEASDFIDQYFNKFKGIKSFIDNTTDEVIKTGKVKTLTGRTRVIPEIRSDSRNVKSHAIRAAINTPIQGTAADILKEAMIRLNGGWKKFDADLLLQVHDELVFEVKNENIKKFSQYLKNEMEKTQIIDIPLKINIDFGKNWLEAH